MDENDQAPAIEDTQPVEEPSQPSQPSQATDDGLQEVIQQFITDQGHEHLDGLKAQFQQQLDEHKRNLSALAERKLKDGSSTLMTYSRQALSNLMNNQ